MATPVNATKEEIGHYITEGPQPVCGIRKDFSEEIVFANSSFTVFIVLISCWQVTIFSLQCEIQVRPHLCSPLWRRRVVFPLFLVKNLLLGSTSQWQRYLSFVVSTQPQTACTAPGLCHHS